MKLVSLFLLLFAVQIQAQTIDCHDLEKIGQSMSKTKWAIQMRSTTTSKRGTMETITEMNSEKRIRTVTKLPPTSPFKKMEMIMIDSIMYSTMDEGKTWTYTETPPKTNYPNMNDWQNYKFKQCQKVGSEVLDGLPFDIIETTVDSVAHISSMRFWVNFDKQIVKKATTEAKANDMTVALEIQYVASVTIEKPLNAVKRARPILPTGQPNAANAPNVDNLPQYKDGVPALFAFLQSHLEYPKAAREAKIEGTVYVGFTVEPDGTVSDVLVKRGIGYDCDEAAIELIKKTSGNWSPALSLD